MKFGFSFYAEPRQAAHAAKIAEDAGWDGLYLGDAIWCQDPMIALAAAAMTTKRIRLGTMVIPVPLRWPWKIASESLALDSLSDGRLTLGLGAGAVWMGWQAFPNHITDTKARVEMLDETVDILTLLYQRKQVDYEGKHFQLKLTDMDLMHYPPKPIQQPCIPIWIPGIWPRLKSMQHVLKCDGLLPQKMDPDKKFVEYNPADLAEMKAYIDANRTLTTPFDYVVEGTLRRKDKSEAQDKLAAWAEAGATWYIEGMWDESAEAALEILRKGPPGRD